MLTHAARAAAKQLNKLFSHLFSHLFSATSGGRARRARRALVRAKSRPGNATSGKVFVAPIGGKRIKDQPRSPLLSQQDCISLVGLQPTVIASRASHLGAFIMQVVDIGLSEIDAFSVQYARAFKPREFRLMFDHSSNWRLAV